MSMSALRPRRKCASLSLSYQEPSLKWYVFIHTHTFENILVGVQSVHILLELLYRGKFDWQ